MVDPIDENGKKTDMSGNTLWVVAGALQRPDGHILMHKRPLGKQHGGLWEYPGGKVEEAEVPVNTLIRELNEELGVQVSADSCEPVAFAEERNSGSGRPIVILLYKVTEWSGAPTALEGGEVDWFAPRSILELQKPPLDEDLTDLLLRQV